LLFRCGYARVGIAKLRLVVPDDVVLVYHRIILHFDA
jgi:hypothetical protein